MERHSFSSLRSIFYLQLGLAAGMPNPRKSSRGLAHGNGWRSMTPPGSRTAPGACRRRKVNDNTCPVVPYFAPFNDNTSPVKSSGASAINLLTGVVSATHSRGTGVIFICRKLASPSTKGAAFSLWTVKSIGQPRLIIAEESF